MMTGNRTNIEAYNKMYRTMEYAHMYPNTNLVRLERWFLKTPGDTLDHGCGYGENLIFLVSRGYRVTGADVSQNLLDYVSLKCQMRFTPPNMYDLKLLDGEGLLPFEDDSFDHVVSLGVLEMMGNPETAEMCVQELARCLRPGGKMIVSTLAPENFFPDEAEDLGNETYRFQGQEVDKTVDVTFELYVPDDEESYAALFPEDCEVQEIGSWDNSYCGVKGRHYVALVTKAS